MQYIPPGFWGRLIARILDSDKFGSTLAKLFVICRVDSNNCQTTVNSQEVAQILNTFNNCTKYSKSSSTQQLQTPPASDAEEASSEAGATTLQLNKPDQKDSGLLLFVHYYINFIQFRAILVPLENWDGGFEILKKH
jgi:hypothetical protein